MEEKVRAIIVRQAGVDLMQKYGHDTLADDIEMVDDLGLDSLDCIELTIAFEDEFGLEIPDEDAEKMKTVGDVITYIKSKQ